MANFGSHTLFTALNNGSNKLEGLTIEKAKDTQSNDIVNSFQYGEYSLVNFAQVSNTFKALANHIYSNFIPQDRIISNSDRADYLDKENGASLIFFKQSYNTSTKTYSEASNSSTDNGANYNLQKYLITGENLRKNIKYHKPKINGRTDYNETSNFSAIEYVSSGAEYNKRQNNLYGFVGGETGSDFLGVQISPSYKEVNSTTKSSAIVNSTDKSITLYISNNFKKNSTDNGATSNVGDTDTTINYYDADFRKHELKISSGGLLLEDKMVGYPKNVNFEGTSKTGDDTTLTFTVLSGVTTGGLVQTRQIQISNRGYIKSVGSLTSQTYKVVSANESQTFTGLKEFSGGIKLPSNGNGVGIQF